MSQPTDCYRLERFFKTFFFFGVYCFITVPLLLVREMRERVSVHVYIRVLGLLSGTSSSFFCAFPQIRFMTHIHLTLLGVCRAYIVVVLIDSLFTLGLEIYIFMVHNQKNKTNSSSSSSSVCNRRRRTSIIKKNRLYIEINRLDERERDLYRLAINNAMQKNLGRSCSLCYK